MDLMVKLEGQIDNGLSVLNATTMINVQSNSIQMISFSVRRVLESYKAYN